MASGGASRYSHYRRRRALRLFREALKRSLIAIGLVTVAVLVGILLGVVCD